MADIGRDLAYDIHSVRRGFWGRMWSRPSPDCRYDTLYDKFDIPRDTYCNPLWQHLGTTHD